MIVWITFGGIVFVQFCTHAIVQSTETSDQRHRVLPFSSRRQLSYLLVAVNRPAGWGRGAHRNRARACLATPHLGAAAGLNDHRHHPSAIRNRGPILEALKSILPGGFDGKVLEIGSGTGCHAEHFSQAFPNLRWQPSEFDESRLQEIDAVCSSSLPNVAGAVKLDASLDWGSWPEVLQDEQDNFDMVYVSNVMHISPWSVARGVLAGAGQALRLNGKLIVYGPFKVNGTCTTESNRAFDLSLQARNPEWGYRDVSEVQAEASKHGFVLQECLDMPSNNFLLHFAKAT